MRWLVVVLLGGCAVEDVEVRTDGAQGDEEPSTQAPIRPQVGDDAPGQGVEEDVVLELTPSSVEAGAALVFVSTAAEGLDLSRTVNIELYGEPDVDLQTWSAEPDEVVLSLWVDEGTPLGDLLVVLEFDDGSVMRPEESLVVR